jgi:signal transduction histidine kinase
MISLRHKLAIGFGGLLLIMAAVSILTVYELTRYSYELERVFHENYDSAIFCDGMRGAIDRLDTFAQHLIWNDAEKPDIDVATEEATFQLNLNEQVHNETLPGEAQRTQQLQNLWVSFKPKYQALLSAGAARADLFRDSILPALRQMRQTARQIGDMNMKNMVSVDGEVKRTLLKVRNVLLVLVIAGTSLASAVVITTGASILRTLGALTRSARRIEAGDLDLNLQVRSRDEIGQLAHAFNSMTEKLREFRKLDHDRLVRTQQTTQLAIDSLPDAVFVIGPGGRVEISNRTARTHFQVEPGALISELHLKWLTPMYESIQIHQKPIEPQGYSAAIQLFEDGRERFLLPRAVPMLGKAHELIGVTVILADVTRLLRADEAKSGLISIVSHELRTPLTGVRMSLSLLASDKFAGNPASQKRLITAAREEGERLHQIIDNLLNISRIESGRAQFQFTRMAPSEIVRNAIGPLAPAFAEKGLATTVDVADRLPMATVDPMAIGSALTNLLTNAMKFTPAPGKVTVAAHAENGALVFEVADTGPGIPAEYRDRIFEKFFRVPSNAGPTGAGLGLTIAREIAEAHGGTLDFHCPPAGGTVFELTIPAGSNAESTATEPKNPRQARPGQFAT